MARRAWGPMAFLASLMIFGLLLAELPAVSSQKYERKHVMSAFPTPTPLFFSKCKP